MKVTSYCPTCLKGTSFDTESAPGTVSCPRCGRSRAVTLSAASRDGSVDVCVLCGCGHLYVEKDFNSWLGGAIMLSAIAGFVWAQSFNILVGFLFLGIAAVLDFAMYRLCALRTICYRCVAMYRRTRPNPAHSPYDLGLAGRFADDYEERRARGS